MWCHVVAKFNPSHGVNFWVRCASGNVSRHFPYSRDFVFSPVSGHFWTEVGSGLLRASKREKFTRGFSIVSSILCLQDLPWCQFRKLVRVRGSYVRIGELRVRCSYVRIAGDGLNWTHGHILTRLLPQTTTSLLQLSRADFSSPHS